MNSAFKNSALMGRDLCFRYSHKNRVGEYSEMKISVSYTPIEHSSFAIGISAGANFQLRRSDLSTHSYSS